MLEGRFALCRLAPDADLPPWATGGGFYSITRTASELSVLCAEDRVPDGVQKSGAWHGIEVMGPLSHKLTGVLESILQPLACGRVSVLAIATYDTDYVFVQAPEKAAGLLEDAGHMVHRR